MPPLVLYIRMINVFVRFVFFSFSIPANWLCEFFEEKLEAILISDRSLLIRSYFLLLFGCQPG
jgi:hypothetical protein